MSFAARPDLFLPLSTDQPAMTDQKELLDFHLRLHKWDVQIVATSDRGRRIEGGGKMDGVELQRFAEAVDQFVRDETGEPSQ